MAERKFVGTGRRKASVARVQMVPGKGTITVNGRDVREFFPYETNIMDLMRVKRHILGTRTLSTIEQLASDLNSDGDINIMDVMKLIKIILI